MAADPCCNTIIGGEVYITARFRGGAGTGGSFAVYEGLGDVRIQPSRVERTAGSTSAGGLWVTERARPVRVMMTFANRCEQNPMRIFQERCNIDITVVEKSRGFMHTISGAVAVGSPELNTATGEVTGMEFASEDYGVHTSGGTLQVQNLLAPSINLLPVGA